MTAPNTLASKLHRGDKATAVKPGTNQQINLVVRKALHLPSGQIEIEWIDETTGNPFYEGLYDPNDVILLVE